MEISSFNRSVQASELPLEKLADSKEISQDDKIAEVSRQFEAVLLRQILSQAQKPMFKSTLMPGGGTTNAIYQDMITQQLADRISQGGTFGFAKVLAQQLSFEYTDPQAENLKEARSFTDVPTAAEAKVPNYQSPAIQPGKRI